MDGQATIGALLMSAGLIALTLGLGALLAETAPTAWQPPERERAQARRQAVETGGELELRWRARAHPGSGRRRG